MQIVRDSCWLIWAALCIAVCVAHHRQCGQGVRVRRSGLLRLTLALRPRCWAVCKSVVLVTGSALERPNWWARGQGQRGFGGSGPGRRGQPRRVEALLARAQLRLSIIFIPRMASTSREAVESGVHFSTRLIQKPPMNMGGCLVKPPWPRLACAGECAIRAAASRPPGWVLA